jgi:ankyrin repeat protein
MGLVGGLLRIKWLMCGRQKSVVPNEEVRLAPPGAKAGVAPDIINAPSSWEGDDGHSVDAATGLAFRKAPQQKANMIASIKRGDATKVKAMVESGADVNATGMWGNTPLIAACQYRKEGLALYLLGLAAHRNLGVKVDVNVVNERGQTAILFAALDGNMEVLELLLDQDADPRMGEVRVYNQMFDENMWLTPLSAAIMNGHIGVVELLLSHGSDANEVYAPENHAVKSRHGGESPLLFALWRRAETKIVQSLLRHGADIFKEDADGESPADLAANAAKDVRNGAEMPAAMALVQEWVDMTNKYEGSEVRGAGPIS